MASWQDGPEYAPTQRPFAFRDVEAPGLAPVPDQPSDRAQALALLEPGQPPINYQDAPHRPLGDAVGGHQRHRDPHAAFTSTAVVSASGGAWGATHTGRSVRQPAPNPIREVAPFADTEPVAAERLRAEAAAIGGRMPRHSFTNDPAVRSLLTPMLTLLVIGLAVGLFAPIAALITLALAFLYSGYVDDRVGVPLARFWVVALPTIFLLGLFWNPRQELWPSLGVVSQLASLVMVVVVLVHPFPDRRPGEQPPRQR